MGESGHTVVVHGGLLLLLHLHLYGSLLCRRTLLRGLLVEGVEVAGEGGASLV